MTKNVEKYFVDGCGRCPLGGTPQCKVNFWIKELEKLRKIILDTGLHENIKWGVPCYTHLNKNILILAAFKDHCSISFFKGALIRDDQKLLEAIGENTQTSKSFKFTNIKEIKKLELFIKSYIFEAIEIEKSGVKIKTSKLEDLEFPKELSQYFKKNKDLETAFLKLTPGKQKGYVLHINQAKQSSTRVSRIEKCIPKIMKGKGVFDY